MLTYPCPSIYSGTLHTSHQHYTQLCNISLQPQGAAWQRVAWLDIQHGRAEDNVEDDQAGQSCRLLGVRSFTLGVALLLQLVVMLASNVKSFVQNFSTPV